MKKINSALRLFNKDLIDKYGDIKCHLYRVWDEVIQTNLAKDVSIRKIAYTNDNKTIIYVSSENNSILLKLHYAIPQIIEQINYKFGRNLNIELKISQ